MINYLSTIEDEYSKLRGMPSRLNPVDWQLADNWEQKGIPLRIVLQAMNDVHKKFTETKRPDSINSLKYFKQAVEKQFAEWQSSQIGKSTDNEENIMQPLSFAAISDGVDETVQILENLVEGFTVRDSQPETLQKTIAVTRGELLALMTDTRQKNLSMNEIEDRLQEIAKPFNMALVFSTDENERAALDSAITREYQNRTLSEESRAKLITKKLYDKFGLPELTLFEI